MEDIKFKAVIGNKYCFHGESLTLKQISKLGDSFFKGDVTWLLYTGQKDKNEAELFEDDIIIHHKYGGYYQILWIADSTGFFIKDSNGITMPLSKLCEPNIEKVGNIYSNPELLKE